jgi:acyl-CoA synthetase (NDP forming)/GNAT superfamily N-acetyltransferase
MAEEYDVLLRDGGIAHIRPLTRLDRAALHDLVERTSDRSAYLRFFVGGKGAAHVYMERITGPDYPGRALVAVIRERLVAVAEYIPTEDGRADLAILIDDSVHGHGLGTLLLEHLALDAAGHGVGELVADILPDNRRLLNVLADLGLEVRRRFQDGTIHATIAVTPTPRLASGIETRDREAERASLARVLNPRSVAVIGASGRPAAIGRTVLSNLVDGGFPGAAYPINPGRADIAGLPCYASVRDAPGPVDLAVVAVPAAQVPGVARECADAGVHGLVVLSSGFAESGQVEAERDLVRICRGAGMRLIGPNCLGLAVGAAHLNATFLADPPGEGTVALMSQSGAVGAALLQQVGVSAFVSVGNKADVSCNDLLEYWEDDPSAEVIALYLESFGNPRRFARIARRVTAKKPVLLVKSGRSESGGRAVRSHTAAAASPDIAVDALVRAAGVVRLDSVRELLDALRLFTTQPPPSGRRVAIVGNSGGPEVMAADACERWSLAVPDLRSGNPLDLTAEATAARIGEAVKTLASSADVDAVLAVYTPPFGDGLEQTARAVAAAAEGAANTVVACLAGHDGVIGDQVPSYAFPEDAVAALARAAGYVGRRAAPSDAPLPPADSARAHSLVAAELAEHPGGRWLPPAEVERLLRCYGLSLAETVRVDGPEPAADAAALVGLPAVLKAIGPVHKTERGGVRLDLRTREEVRQAYREMAANLGKEMTGAIVQSVLTGGAEIIIGGVNYPVFGPLVMVGMGGILSDLVADHVFRVPPLTGEDVAEMLGELRCAPLLCDYRGRAPLDKAALADQIRRVGRLVEELPEVAELDMNPVIVTADGATAVDARVRVAVPEQPSSPLLRRLR